MKNDTVSTYPYDTGVVISKISTDQRFSADILVDVTGNWTA